MTMENKIPLFSLLIPTRNRAHLLRYALESVLMQDWDDYELIVSDNDSSDGTKEFVAGFAHPRLHYIRPPAYLYVSDHWNFAIRHARGKYVLMLADDDCLVPHALQTFADVAQKTGASIIGCTQPDYFSPDFPIESQQNTLLLPAFSGAVKYLEMRQVLVECFSFNPAYYPRVTTLIAREIVERIQQQFGYFFAMPFPEYVAYTMAFSLVKEYVLVDKPLVIMGRTPASLGPNYFWFGSDPAWGEAGKFSFQNTPLKGMFATNGIAESLLRAKRNLLENFQGIDLAYDKYYSNYYADMLAQQKLGRNVEREKNEYQLGVEALSGDLRRRVLIRSREIERRRSFGFQLLGKAKRTILQILSAAQARVHSPNRVFSKGGLIRGEEISSTDILSCAKWLATIADGSA